MVHLALKKSSFHYKYWYFCLFHIEEQCLPTIHLYWGVFDFFYSSTNTVFQQLGSNLICREGGFVDTVPTVMSAGRDESFLP